MILVVDLKKKLDPDPACIVRRQKAAAQMIGRVAREAAERGKWFSLSLYSDNELSLAWHPMPGNSAPYFRTYRTLFAMTEEMGDVEFYNFLAEHGGPLECAWKHGFPVKPPSNHQCQSCGSILRFHLGVDGNPATMECGDPYDTGCKWGREATPDEEAELG